MKKIIFIMAAVTISLAGCTPTPHVDAEFGRESRANWDRQIANADPARGETPPEGMEGINAEEMMSAYNSSFSKPASRSSVFTIGFRGLGD